MKKIVALLGLITLTSITYGAGLEPRPRLERGASDTLDVLQYEAVPTKTLIQSRGTKRKREKPAHQCPEPWCGKTFTQLHSLKVHMLSHTGEKPHKCLTCNQRFMSNGNLKRHMENKHPEKIIGFLPPTESVQTLEEPLSLDLDAPFVSPLTALVIPVASKDEDAPARGSIDEALNKFLLMPEDEEQLL